MTAKDLRSLLYDVPDNSEIVILNENAPIKGAVAGNIPVSPTGSSKAETLKKEIKLVIEKIILNDTGDKDKKQLVKELLEELIEELKGADEVISSADLGVLL